MLNRQRYDILARLVMIKTNISFSLLIMDMILILQISNVIEIGYMVNLLLKYLLPILFFLLLYNHSYNFQYCY